jgi:hypothetical protein
MPLRLVRVVIRRLHNDATSVPNPFTLSGIRICVCVCIYGHVHGELKVTGEDAVIIYFLLSQKES